MSDDQPTTVQDWFMAGVIFGWQTPVCTATGPAFLSGQALSEYFRGVQVGGEARLAFEDQQGEPYEAPTDGPSIGPTPGGAVPLEEATREQREILEGLFHQHMPHVDLPEYEPWYPPFGGMTQQPVP
jgi:hypothetical protein